MIKEEIEILYVSSLDKEHFTGRILAVGLGDPFNVIGKCYDDFISELAKLGGVDRETVLKYTEDYQPNLELLDYIREKLKSHYRLGIISNAGADWVLQIIGQENQELFDDIVLSYMTGFIKPEPEIYEMSIKNLGARAKDCVFIDDVLTYCQGAEVVGMNTIWYKDFEQMKTELEKLLAAGPND